MVFGLVVDRVVGCFTLDIRDAEWFWFRGYQGWFGASCGRLQLGSVWKMEGLGHRACLQVSLHPAK